MHESKWSSRNRYEIGPEVCTLIITRANGNQYRVTFDTADLSQVQRHLWHIITSGTGGGRYPYAATRSNVNPLFLSRLLTAAPISQHIGHQNGDTLDYRRANLRAKSQAKRHKTDPMRNIYPLTDSSIVVKLKRAGRRYHLGTFKSIEAARDARDQWVADYARRQQPQPIAQAA